MVSIPDNVKKLLTVVAAIGVVASVQLATAFPVAAHERRMVGPYSLLVGWLNEPALQGERNAATVQVTDTRVTPAKPVEGLEKTIKVSVTAGGLSNAFTDDLRAVEETPGLYALDFIPTVAGSYTFRITGKVETLDVNETFESGPGRFDDVVPQAQIQYPARVEAGADLAARLDGLESDIRWLKVIAYTTLAVAILFPIGLITIRRRR